MIVIIVSPQSLKVSTTGGTAISLFENKLFLALDGHSTAAGIVLI